MAKSSMDELERGVKGMDIKNLTVQEKETSKKSPVENMETCSSSSSTSSPISHGRTKVIFMLGMAGSGKTTFTQRLAAHLLAQRKTPYILNFDPACEDPPFPVNIDIRDTVKYKKVMEEYKLGPNGGIVTSLNLFATIFDQVLEIVKARSKSHEYVLIDTPGQVECFLWSASGQIFLHSFAAQFPTIITYVTDLTLAKNPITFASNMMYGVTILYRSKLPMIIALNKSDLEPGFGKIVSRWLTDFEELEEAIGREEGYTTTLASSLTLALEEFYKVVNHCVVSSFNGFGFKDYEILVEKGVEEYNNEYLQMYQGMKEDYEKRKQKKKDDDLARFRKDFHKGMRDQAFSMQATSTLSEGIHLLPPDDEEEITSQSEEDEEEAGEDEEETISDLRKKETGKREKKRTEFSLLAKGSAQI